MVLALTESVLELPTEEKIHKLIFFICKCPLSIRGEREGSKNQSHGFKSLLRFVFQLARSKKLMLNKTAIKIIQKCFSNQLKFNIACTFSTKSLNIFKQQMPRLTHTKLPHADGQSRTFMSVAPTVYQSTSVTTGGFFIQRMLQLLATTLLCL